MVCLMEESFAECDMMSDIIFVFGRRTKEVIEKGPVVPRSSFQDYHKMRVLWRSN